MELKLGVELLDNYKRLPYKVWYAFAEFIDNSTQSYENNKAILDAAYQHENTGLHVSIRYQNGNGGFISIEDNSIGMDYDDLESAMTIGKKPSNTNGRSKYGLGLKTASFWFGDRWEIITKKLDHAVEYKVVVDLSKLREQNETNINATGANANEETEKPSTVLQFEETSDGIDPGSHYTKITITRLNRNIHGNSARKVIDYLRSIYRYDLENGNLLLEFQNQKLTWSSTEFEDRMLKDDKGRPFYENFSFKINDKKVRGWAGVLEKGSRRDAGFSILQANRVIQGWPEGYRPPKLFGDQEGGTNNLVNQRLFGELFLDGFDVSHTKDEILFTDDDEEVLNETLFEFLAHLKKAAAEYRKPEILATEDSYDYRGIVTNIFQQLQVPKFRAAITELPVLPPEIIESSNEELIDRVLASEQRDTYSAEVSGIKITVIINVDGSNYDPYLVIRSTAKREEIIVVINRNHKHWETLKTFELVIYFLKQCVYDALAEWKANFIADSLDPNTIKLIKDTYLKQEIDLV